MLTIRHLFIARHGNYGQDSGLDESGRQQMENLAEVMKEILNGDTAYIVSSTAPSASDSAEVLAAELSLQDFEKTLSLWSGRDSPLGKHDADLEGLMELVNKNRDKAEGLILVTHYEVVDEFPMYFWEKEFGSVEHIPRPSKGEAVYINLEEKTYRMLP